MLMNIVAIEQVNE